MGDPIGLAIYALAVLGFGYFAILSRIAALDPKIDTITLTALPLAIGGGLLLAIAIPFEGFPSASLRTWGLVLVLTVVNTALGYVLYYHALQKLQAFEMNVMLNLTPIGTAILGWLLLDELLTGTQWAGISVVITGAVLVQKRINKKKTLKK